MNRCCYGQILWWNYWGINKVLCLLLDERLYKGVEGTGPRQCGGAAERPQVSLGPVGQPTLLNHCKCGCCLGPRARTPGLTPLHLLIHVIFPTACWGQPHFCHPLFTDGRNWNLEKSAHLAKVTQQMAEPGSKPRPGWPRRSKAWLPATMLCGWWGLAEEEASPVSLPPAPVFSQTWLHRRIMWVAFENTDAQGPTQARWVRIAGVGPQASILHLWVCSEGPWVSHTCTCQHWEPCSPLSGCPCSWLVPTSHARAPAVFPRAHSLNPLQGRYSCFSAVTYPQEFVESCQSGLQSGKFMVPAVSFIFDFPQFLSTSCT